MSLLEHADKAKKFYNYTIKSETGKTTYTIHTLEEFEDTKGVIRIRKSKDRQHNDKKKKDKQRSTNT